MMTIMTILLIVILNIILIILIPILTITILRRNSLPGILLPLDQSTPPRLSTTHSLCLVTGIFLTLVCVLKIIITITIIIITIVIIPLPRYCHILTLVCNLKIIIVITITITIVVITTNNIIPLCTSLLPYFDPESVLKMNTYFQRAALSVFTSDNGHHRHQACTNFSMVISSVTHSKGF